MSSITPTPRPAPTASASNPSVADRQPPPWRALIGALLLPLFLLVFLPMSYLGGLHKPAPHDMRVDIIGSGAQPAALATGLATRVGDSFAVGTADTVAEAQSRLRHLEIRAAYDPATATVFVAGAGSAVAANTVEKLFTSVASQAGKNLTVRDVAPLPSSDRLGISFLFLGVAAVVAGFLTATVLHVAVGSLSIRQQLGILAGISVMSAVIPMFTAYCVYGALASGIVGVGALLAAVAFVTGVFHLGGLRLIGPGMILVTLLFGIILGIPASGVAVPPDMLPSFYNWLHPLLSTPAALDGLRRVLYFHGTGIARDIVALAMWALIGFALLALSTLKSPGAAGQADPLVTVAVPRAESNDPDAVALSRRRLTAAVLVMPLFFLIFLPLSFLGALHSPTPYHVKVAVIGSGERAGAVVKAIEDRAGGALDVSQVASVGEARAKLLHLGLRGAYNPATGDLYLASAGGGQASATVTSVFTSVAAASDTTLQTHDVAPLTSKDPAGNSLLYVGIGAILAGFVAAVVSSIAVPGVSTVGRIATVVVMSAVAAGVETLLGWTVFDAFDGQALPAAAMFFGLALVSGLLTLGGARFIGPAMIPVSILVLIMLGVPASGMVVPLDLASPFYGIAHNLLPTATGLDGLRRIVYFDGHGLGGDLLTTSAWALGSLVLIAVGRQKHRARTDGLLDNPEIAEGTAAAAAAAVG